MSGAPLEVMAGYEALRDSAGIVGGAHEIVWVDGPDALAFLDELLSQDIAGIPVGGAAPSLLLAPQGKLRATLWVLRGEDRIGLVADAGRGEIVAGDLTRFKIRVEVDISVEAGPVIDVWGPEAAAALSSIGLDVPPTPGWTQDGDRVVAALPFARIGLARYVTVGIPATDMTGSGAVDVTDLAARAVRIEAGEPLMGVDIDDRTIPQEAGIVEGSVDFTKGCYLGQELVARIDSRGRVNRHLRGVVVVSGVSPPGGAEIFFDGRVVGTLSSVAESGTLGGAVALALVRREVTPGATVEIRWQGGSAEARVEDLPLDASL